MRKVLVVLSLALALAGAWYLGTLSTGATTVQAQAKVEKIKNAEAHLLSLDEFNRGDMQVKLDIIAKLLADKKFTYSQARGSMIRVIVAMAREKGWEKDLPTFTKWLGEQMKDYKGAVNIACRNTGALYELMDNYGARRLFEDETFRKADIKGKLKRVKELWTAREIGQTMTYSINDGLVYQYLAPAKGDIKRELELFGEIYREDITVWDSTASIHRGLLLRGLYEQAELATLDQKIEWVTKVTNDKNGAISWMSAGSTRIFLFMQLFDAEFAMGKANLEDRKAKISDYEKRGLLNWSDAATLREYYCEIK